MRRLTCILHIALVLLLYFFIIIFKKKSCLAYEAEAAIITIADCVLSKVKIFFSLYLLFFLCWKIRSRGFVNDEIASVAFVMRGFAAEVTGGQKNGRQDNSAVRTMFLRGFIFVVLFVVTENSVLIIEKSEYGRLRNMCKFFFFLITVLCEFQ